MYCDNCGTSNRADAKFCVKCGASLALEKSSSREVKTKKENNKGILEKYGVAVVAIVIVVALSGFIGYPYFSSLYNSQVSTKIHNTGQLVPAINTTVPNNHTVQSSKSTASSSSTTSIAGTSATTTQLAITPSTSTSISASTTIIYVINSPDLSTFPQ